MKISKIKMRLGKKKFFETAADCDRITGDQRSEVTDHTSGLS